MRIRGIIFGIIAFLTCLLVVAQQDFPKHVIGYYITSDEKLLARYLSTEGLPPTACRQLIHFDVLGPSVSSKRKGCIAEYAELTKSPGVCELLMPSEYGLFCIGRARKEFDICRIGFGRIVEWGSYGDGTHVQATLDECVFGEVSSANARECCTISKVANLRSENDCSSLADKEKLHAECLEVLAIKKEDVAVCLDIKSINAREICVLRSRYRDAMGRWPGVLNEKKR